MNVTMQGIAHDKWLNRTVVYPNNDEAIDSDAVHVLRPYGQQGGVAHILSLVLMVFVTENPIFS
jgi:hypothetical protein